MTPRILATLLLLAPPAWAQIPPPIGIIDTYGLGKTTPEAVRSALGVAVGDPVPASVDGMVARLQDLPGVEIATINLVCCEEGKTILYIGIVEDGVEAPVWNPEPLGSARLTDSIRALGAAFDSAFEGAIRAGDMQEDDSAGHALMHYPPAREIQELFPAIANRERALLRTVLAQSANGADRALAAQIMAYASDKAAVVPDLVTASHDSNETVRNNAVRALAVMAGGNRPVKVPYEPFLTLLQSPVWTDRNKASLALMQLSASRDPELMAALRPVKTTLMEMADWKSMGHAYAPLLILGRLGGLSENEIGTALRFNDRETIFRSVE
jgi:hypothetical protein